MSYVCELFNANGNSSGLYWAHGTLTVSKYDLACKFSYEQAAALCELLNEQSQCGAGIMGRYWRTIGHDLVQP